MAGKCRNCLMTELWKSSLGPGELCLHPNCSLNLAHRKQWLGFIWFPFQTEFLNAQYTFQTSCEPTASRAAEKIILSLPCVRPGPSKHFSPLIFTYTVFGTHHCTPMLQMRKLRLENFEHIARAHILASGGAGDWTRVILIWHLIVIFSASWTLHSLLSLWKF